MNHKIVGRKFNRTTSHRKAMFKNMACSFIEHKEIRTTLPKAKEFRRFIEPLITLAKNGSLHSRRLAFARLRSKKAVTKLFENIGPENKDRNGGYVRVYKIGLRAGDAAPMALVQLCSEADKILSQQG